MKKTVITADTAIWRVVMIKGQEGGTIIDQFLCDTVENLCCPGTSLLLGYAADLKNKKEVLPLLLESLNSIEDVCCKNGCIFCVPPIS